MGVSPEFAERMSNRIIEEHLGWILILSETFYNDDLPGLCYNIGLYSKIGTDV